MENNRCALKKKKEGKGGVGSQKIAFVLKKMHADFIVSAFSRKCHLGKESSLLSPVFLVRSPHTTGSALRHSSCCVSV